MAKKKGDYQPSKYDWIALEASFLASDESSVAKFFRALKIPKKTYERAAVGWGEKKVQLRKNGLKLFKNRLTRENAEQAEAELILSKAVTSVGSEALFPPGNPKAGLKPTTAREAAQLIHLGNSMRKSVLSSMEEAVRVEISSTEPPMPADPKAPPTGPDGTQVVTVSIKLPAKNPPPE